MSRGTCVRSKKGEKLRERRGCENKSGKVTTAATSAQSIISSCRFPASPQQQQHANDVFIITSSQRGEQRCWKKRAFAIYRACVNNRDHRRINVFVCLSALINIQPQTHFPAGRTQKYGFAADADVRLFISCSLMEFLLTAAHISFTLA